MKPIRFQHKHDRKDLDRHTVLPFSFLSRLRRSEGRFLGRPLKPSDRFWVLCPRFPEFDFENRLPTEQREGRGREGRRETAGRRAAEADGRQARPTLE